jgi:type III secretion protein J
MNKVIRSFTLLGLLSALLLLAAGCDSNREVVSNVDEKEANVILVLLESKGIPAAKTAAATSAIGGEGGGTKYSIMVPEKYSIEAIAYLNQNGFPRTKGTTLLDLFAKQGLMTSDKEETIRYQAGLAQQLTNTILMIDGVIDANVQLSFPPDNSTLGGQETEQKKITAAVYVKHQGVIDDPNIHLETKIKRLISGSISGLDINDVTVVSDRSRFTDITLENMPEALGGRPGEYVSVWNIVMSKNSVVRFRILFFIITTLAVLLAIILAWISWKFYPQLKKKGGLKELFDPIPLINSIRNKPPSEPPGEGEA